MKCNLRPVCKHISSSKISNLTLGYSQKYRYMFCAIHLNTNLSTAVHKYPTCYKAFMLRIINGMILCR